MSRRRAGEGPAAPPSLEGSSPPHAREPGEIDAPEEKKFGLSEVAAFYEDLASLNPWPDNPRDNDDGVESLKESLWAFGFGRPFIAWKRDGERRICVGHTTRRAYLELLEEHPSWTPAGVPRRGLVPVRWRDDWTEAEAAGYALADNKTAELSQWDMLKLPGVVQHIASLPGGDDVLPAMGWPDDELADLLKSPDLVPDPPRLAREAFTSTIKFDNERQQAAWFAFKAWLKKGESGDTFGERLEKFLVKHTPREEG